ncbi:MAG: TetR family transcriptional regulator, partial [Oliverpabstia sp.]
MSHNAEKQEQMKYRLADAMKQCMKETSVEKITVKEIVETCGTT